MVPTMKFTVPSSIMSKTKEHTPLSPYMGTSIYSVLQKMKHILWEVFVKVTHYWINSILNTTMIFICLGDTVAMMGDSTQKVLGLEAQGQPRSGPGPAAEKMDIGKATMETVENLDISVIKSDMFEIKEVMLLDWLDWDCEEEEENDGDDSEDSEDEEDEQEQDGEDSDWSDEEGDCEISTESTEAWESFFNDPYNPFKFSCPTAVKTKSPDTAQSSTTNEAEKATSTREEKSCLELSTKKGKKKVHFGEEVTVHQLEEWDGTSREARDGSCWLEMARDRDRFRRRVEKVAELISPCLEAQNRARAWDRIQKACPPEQS